MQPDRGRHRRCRSTNERDDTAAARATTRADDHGDQRPVAERSVKRDERDEGRSRSPPSRRCPCRRLRLDRSVERSRLAVRVHDRTEVCERASNAQRRQRPGSASVRRRRRRRARRRPIAAPARAPNVPVRPRRPDRPFPCGRARPCCVRRRGDGRARRARRIAASTPSARPCRRRPRATAARRRSHRRWHRACRRPRRRDATPAVAPRSGPCIGARRDHEPVDCDSSVTSPPHGAGDSGRSHPDRERVDGATPFSASRWPPTDSSRVHPEASTALPSRSSTQTGRAARTASARRGTRPRR